MIERHLKHSETSYGGAHVYNRVNQILEQYPFTVNQTYKGRGATICDTDQGLKILKEYKGSEARADFLYKTLLFVRESGQRQVDCIVQTKEERSIARDTDETTYLVRDWYEGRECDVRNRDDILKAIRHLASVHTILRRFKEDIPEFLKVRPDTLFIEYGKHSRELKKVKHYIGEKKKKNDFEMAFARNCGMFLEQADQVMALQEKELQAAGKDEGRYGICHGDFNQHNVIFSREGVCILNYEKAIYDVQVGDLGNFMRKILEKHNWNLGLGMDMLDAYGKLRALSDEELKQLYIRLAYPEKFWKICNHYYNTSKAWVCGRDLEKLIKVVEQDETKKRFLQVISHNLLF